MVLRTRNSQVIADSVAFRHRADSASRAQPINIFNSPVGDWRFVNRNWFQFRRHLIPWNRGRLSDPLRQDTINLPC